MPSPDRNDSDFEFSLWPPRVRGRGVLSVIGAILVALFIVGKADLPSVGTVWRMIAERSLNPTNRGG